MTQTRRSLMGLIARIALGVAPVGARFTSRPAHAGAGRSRTLAAYLDALIPDDDLGPGAVTLGVDEHLAALASESFRYRRLLDQGCRWLDEQARESGAADFAGLDAAARDRVIFLAAEADPRSVARRFFDRTRRDAFSHYYAQPEAWAAIGYDGPPQPAGFMDYALPPEQRR